MEHTTSNYSSSIHKTHTKPQKYSIDSFELTPTSRMDIYVLYEAERTKAMYKFPAVLCYSRNDSDTKTGESASNYLQTSDKVKRCFTIENREEQSLLKVRKCF